MTTALKINFAAKTINNKHVNKTINGDIRWPMQHPALVGLRTRITAKECYKDKLHWKGKNSTRPIFSVLNDWKETWFVSDIYFHLADTHATGTALQESDRRTVQSRVHSLIVVIKLKFIRVSRHLHTANAISPKSKSNFSKRFFEIKGDSFASFYMRQTSQLLHQSWVQRPCNSCLPSLGLRSWQGVASTTHCTVPNIFDCAHWTYLYHGRVTW